MRRYSQERWPGAVVSDNVGRAAAADPDTRTEMPMPTVSLIGAPIDSGQRRRGCLMGPAAYRVAGLAATLAELGHEVIDRGDLVALKTSSKGHKFVILGNLTIDSVGWTLKLEV